MSKRIVICADGTWNRPEQDLATDYATNVLKIARAIEPIAVDGKLQQVFYDWGIGSYHDAFVAGATGRGLHKNIMDGYRYIVQNYAPGDEIWLFGFSRGAYTVRCLSGLIYNCGIIKRPEAKYIQQAFEHYKTQDSKYAPDGTKSVAFRAKYSHPSSDIAFIGVWDTVGAMGIPISFLGLFEDKDEFYDTKIGPNVNVARHALAIDEHRQDFAPTIWSPRNSTDIQQVWFAGSHSNVGGSYPPDEDGSSLSDIPLQWMMEQARLFGLSIENHLLSGIVPNPLAKLVNSRRKFYRIKTKTYRQLTAVESILVHPSVKLRWQQDSEYRPKNLVDYAKQHHW
ncbi:DUF2235 domain-containing protein [Shewanella aestuarii]|uniref:DUF2235 domain-containing protein n=1 Tax=Shewanella aestuarii TaxID=1028752 RepID=A0A6G9QLB4_9GAMM|nr:DUF2235 domain-containing protein [Shewanella aestuarii]QIR15374.1 DUF2235 domain-containing protein [Shewanella aestuarii]